MLVRGEPAVSPLGDTERVFLNDRFGFFKSI